MLYDPNFSFDKLFNIPTECSHAFARDRLLGPVPGEPGQRRKDKFNALLSAEPWPASCHRIRSEVRPHLEQLIWELLALEEERVQSAGGPMPLVNTQDLADEEVLIIIRNAESWITEWRKKGSPSDHDFKGFLVIDINGKLRPSKTSVRRVIGTLQQMPVRRDNEGNEGDSADQVPDSASETEAVAHHSRFVRGPAVSPTGQEPAQRKELYGRLVRKLDRFDRNIQRCVRLRVGLYPLIPGLDQPLEFPKIAEHLRMTEDQVRDLYDRGIDGLRSEGAG